MIDAVDTYLRYVRSRLQTINPERVVKGPMDSQDWPTKPIVNEALYLLTLSEQEGNGTPSNPIYSHTLQWVWVVFGDDLAPDKKGRNRGNRYRVDLQIKDELVRATWPHFTPKFHLSTSGSTLLATAIDPPEAIYWTKLEFGPKKGNRDSGVIYGYGSTHVTQFNDQITS